MGQNTSATHKKSKKIRDLENTLPFEDVLNPNGFMPPELIVAIINLSDLPTIHRMAQSCKLWYETCWHGRKLRSWTKIQENFKNGNYWAEPVAAHFFYLPYSRVSSSLLSVDDTSLVTNATRFDDMYRLEKRSTRVTDLNTGQQKEIPGPAILANGYLLKSSEPSTIMQTWKHVQVLTKNLEAVCEFYRSRPPVQVGSGLLTRSSGLKVNRDGSARIILHDFETKKSPPYVNFEEYDLRTGSVTREWSLPPFQLREYCGDLVFGWRKEEFIVIDLNNTDSVQTFNGVFACNLHNNRVRVVAKLSDHTLLIIAAQVGLLFKDEVRLYDLRTQPLQQIASVKIDHSFLIEKEQVSLTNHGIAFDNSIVVVAAHTHDNVPILFIYDLKTGEFLNYIQNPHPKFDDAAHFHIHSPSKIIVDYDCGNTTVYDFDHPYLTQTVEIIRCDEEKLYQYSVRVEKMQKFLSTWLEACDTSTKTFSRINSEGVEERLTIIKPRLGSAPTPLVSLFKGGWERLMHIRNTFQYTQSPPRIKNAFHDIRDECTMTVEHTDEQMCIIFERFNKDTKLWELCEPILSEDLAKRVVKMKDKKMTSNDKK